MMTGSRAERAVRAGFTAIFGRTRTFGLAAALECLGRRDQRGWSAGQYGTFIGQAMIDAVLHPDR
ncbi:MAG TPA: hypothetical protein VF477_05685 [Mycobacterium sp.]